MQRHCLGFTMWLTLCACDGAPKPVGADAERATPAIPFTVHEISKFDEPWAMAFLPDGRLLVTEKAGKLKLYAPGGEAFDVAGVPAIDYGGQGGLGDVVLHPDFANTGFIYLSFVESGDGNTRGAAVARGRLVIDEAGGRIDAPEVIWRQEPKVSGRGHFGHRLAFGPEGFLYISSGDRQKFDPAQDMNANLGKIIRLTDTGMVPSDNPFYDQGRITSQIWSLGHRNPLGLAFDAGGRLWNHEMGPRGGDELNLVKKSDNYGYPIVSNGDHYDGRNIPDHITRAEFTAPEISWTPVISPAGLIFYSGKLFPNWQSNAFIGGLSSEALVRIEFHGTQAREAERFDMGARIREVEQGPDGAIWLLEDGENGRLLKLTPAR